jgi:hypothetical protein
MAKHPHKPYPLSNEPHTSHMLDLIHSDLCSPFPTATPHGKLHFVVFLDDHTNLLSLQLLTIKDQALAAWEIVQKQWENYEGRRVKVFCSDNGGKFLSTAFTEALQLAGIKCQLSAPYTHQQNGKAERAIHTIEGHMFAMLETTNLPAMLWGEAALTACYLWNCSESCTLPPGITPYQLVNGRKLDLSHLCVFGARCFTQIPSELQTKMGLQSCPAIFMGYPDGVKGYCLHDKDTGIFFTAHDIIFDKNLPSIPAGGNDSDSNSDGTNTTANTHIITQSASQPPTPSLALSSPQQTTTTCRSTRNHVPTPAGEAYAGEIAATKAHLLTLRNACTEHQGPLPAISEEVETAQIQDDAEITDHADSAELVNIEPNTEQPEVLTNLLIEECANMSICSNHK